MHVCVCDNSCGLAFACSMLKNNGAAPSRLAVLTLPTKASKRARFVVGLKN